MRDKVKTTNLAFRGRNQFSPIPKMGRRDPWKHKEKVGVCPQIPDGVKTRDYVAERAGFDSEKTARQATFVVDYGQPELVQQVHRDLSPHQGRSYSSGV
jgi:hypothetical protein